MPNICSILENVPCTLGKSIYALFVGWSVLYMSVRSGWLTVLFKRYGLKKKFSFETNNRMLKLKE